MLAYMTPSSAQTDLYQPSPPDATTRKMSVTILSSAPMPCNRHLPPSAPSPSKRPKLTLDTSDFSTVLGKSSTSLRLETLSATSPTVRNTFQNAHSPSQAVVPHSHTSPMSAAASDYIDGGDRPHPLTPSRHTGDDHDHDHNHNDHHHKENNDAQQESNEPLATSPTASIMSSSSTIDSSSSDRIPYVLPFSTNSILRNGPIPRAQKRKLSTFSQSRLMFPAAKKVDFRAPLTEEIWTIKYTLRHSDLDSSSSTISTLELTPSSDDDDDDDDEHNNNNDNDSAAHSNTLNRQPDQHSLSSDYILPAKTYQPQKRKAVPAKPSGQQHDNGKEDEVAPLCPQTPVAGRQRHRQWRWTLGPIDSDAVDTQADGQQRDSTDETTDLL